MRIDIATLFTEMCDSVLHESIVGRGIKNGFIEIYTHDIRNYTENRHRKVDDKPYGGGTGMVMQAQPIYDCITDILSKHEKRPRIIYMSPQGETLTQEKVKELAAEDGLILLCGHYEGVDQRVLDELECEELSVGDYVLTGGELPALIVADAVARLQRGVLPNEDAYSIESHYNGLLEHPQYTMPRVWRGREVPVELTLGNHEVIAQWQRKAALRITAEKRPDMHEEYMDRLVQEFWDGFIREKGLDEDTDYVQIFRVGSNEGESNRLLRLILRGKKRATTYLYDDDILPEKGDYSIITDWDGVPRCVVRTTRVQIIPFNEITLEQALKEGEDKTLGAWRETHRAVYIRYAEQLGYEFSEDTKIVYEEFHLEYRKKTEG
ncbi:MAG: tRNA (guanosine(37)-N1)-methyltransferase TrmD [Oscillospiraceae bacterium]|nr:tRNA (guanosine(37)-N1)-methyltransferase TrmD [Oscillospiraceae bacterium]